MMRKSSSDNISLRSQPTEDDMANPARYKIIFSPVDEKYYCCCGNIHVLSATKAIAVVCLLMLVCEALTIMPGYHAQQLTHTAQSSFANNTFTPGNNSASSRRPEAANSNEASYVDEDVQEAGSAGDVVRMGLQIGSLLVGAVVMLALVIGLLLERKLLLLPFIISMTLSVVMTALLTFFLAVILIGNFHTILLQLLQQKTVDELEGSANAEYVVRLALTMSVVIMVAIVVLQFWWLAITVRCYHYLDDKQRSRSITYYPVSTSV